MGFFMLLQNVMLYVFFGVLRVLVGDLVPETA